FVGGSLLLPAGRCHRYVRALSFPQLKHVVTPSSRSAQFCWGESPTTSRQMSSICEGQRISGCLCSISVKRGLRYIRNKIGHMGDPCGIPVSIGDIFSESLSKLSLAMRSLRKHSSHLTVLRSIFTFLIV